MQQDRYIPSYPANSSAGQTTSHINTNENNYQLAVHFMKFEYEHESSVIYSTLQESETKPT